MPLVPYGVGDTDHNQLYSNYIQCKATQKLHLEMLLNIFCYSYEVYSTKDETVSFFYFGTTIFTHLSQKTSQCRLEAPTQSSVQAVDTV